MEPDQPDEYIWVKLNKFEDVQLKFVCDILWNAVSSNKQNVITENKKCARTSDWVLGTNESPQKCNMCIFILLKTINFAQPSNTFFDK
jgi:hypothetical protein